MWAADLGSAGRPTVVAQARFPITAQAPSPQQRPRLISLDFKDADINNILRILAEFSGLNIVTSEDVKGKVTVKLSNVPWQQALDSVVRASKLAYVQEGNIIRVDKLENLTKEAEAGFKSEQREVEITQRKKEAELRLAEQERAAELSRREFELRKKELDDRAAPLVEEIIQLKYAHVGPKRANTLNFLTDAVQTEEEKGIEDAITGGVKKEEGKPAGLLSPRGQLTIEQRTNSLVIRDTADNLARIKEFVARMDRPSPTILIESRVVEMSKDDARSLGVIWGGIWTPRAGQDGPIVDLKGAIPGVATPGTAPAAGAPPASTAANFPALTPTAFAGTPFGLALGWLASNFALDISLQALEGQRRARVLSSPSLMTLENQPATIASGTKFPIISVTSVGGAQQATVTFQDVTTRLQVTPRVVTGEPKLLLGISVKRESVLSTITTATLTAPVVNTRQTSTQAEIPDGGTLVIGGLREDTSRDQGQGVPWLSKIPVVGWLFKNDLVEAARTELVVFLTAKIVQSPGQASVVPDLAPGAPGVPPSPPGPSGQAPGPAPAAALPAASARSQALLLLPPPAIGER